MSLDIFEVGNTEDGTQAPGQSYLMEKYNIGVTLASSGLSFYVLGFATGPLICGYFTLITRDRRSSNMMWIGTGGNLVNLMTSRLAHRYPDRPTFRIVRSETSVSNCLASFAW
jgi:hypothetical protein